MKKILSVLAIIVFCAMAIVGICFVLHIYNIISDMADKDRRRGYDDTGWQYNYDINKYGEDISILVDFSLPSSRHRFFVVDNKTGQIISSSKCAHGSGGGSTASQPVFSNSPGSNCSSLGAYRLLYNDKMRNNSFPCIRLKGLEATNSNAFARGIVIHEGPVITDDITLGMTIPVSSLISQGCFTISSETFRVLQESVDNKKTIYLYAFDSLKTALV